MRYYAVIDTNVLVSALLNYSSVPGRIVRESMGGAITPLYSSEILAEYEEVLRRTKFPFEESDIEAVLSGIREYGVKVDAGRMNFEVRDPDDVVFYAVVMEKRKEADAYLVTGNIKHFPQEPFVVTPREMLDIIEAGQRKEEAPRFV